MVDLGRPQRRASSWLPSSLSRERKQLSTSRPRASAVTKWRSSLVLLALPELGPASSSSASVSALVSVCTLDSGTCSVIVRVFNSCPLYGAPHGGRRHAASRG